MHLHFTMKKCNYISRAPVLRLGINLKIKFGCPGDQLLFKWRAWASGSRDMDIRQRSA